jgi:hypothetical protein
MREVELWLTSCWILKGGSTVMREVATKGAGAETTNKRTKARSIERTLGDRSLRGVLVAEENS